MRSSGEGQEQEAIRVFDPIKVIALADCSARLLAARIMIAQLRKRRPILWRTRAMLLSLRVRGIIRRGNALAAAMRGARPVEADGSE